MAAKGEDALVAWLRQRPIGVAAIGDDAALLPAQGELAITLDHQIEGVHFPPGLAPERIARRLAAVNLSDLAASGARPRFALLALAAPPEFPHRRFFRALVTALSGAGASLVGGDLARAERCSAALTLAGNRPRGGRWLRRNGGSAGERLWLGGTIGESFAGRELVARGARLRGPRGVALPPSLDLPRPLRPAARRAVLRHLAPRPQLELGLRLGRERRGAAIDLSDGLACDLHRLARASGVGAVVESERLPIPPDTARLLAHLGHPPQRAARAGGEDYVLLFSLPQSRRPPASWGCYEIGRLVEGRGVALVEAGRQRPLAAEGWDHLRPSGRGSE